MATVQQRATQNDQLGFFLFLALALHLMFILGVAFSREGEDYVAPQLEVTLAQYSSKQTPEDARFIAQANQSGSGTLSERSEITTRELAEFSDNQIRQVSAAPRIVEPSRRVEQQVSTTALTPDKIFQEPQQTEEELVATVGNDPKLNNLSTSIASLEARLDQQQQEYAQRPKVHRLTSLSAKQAVDAAYLHSWRSQVEAIGNRHYPVVSSRYGIYGDLRLMVAIRYDGTIDEIEILSSSGHAVLDEAAIRIVRMAAPFAPFPPALREKADRLEIIRTWKFKQNRLSSVQG
jgi:periplasmic protein TonB